MVRIYVTISQPFPVNVIHRKTLGRQPLIQHQGPVLVKKSSPRTSYERAKKVIPTVDRATTLEIIIAI